MSNTPLVSVVIPCLNRADLLAPTIESVLEQDYPHIECIVVDGGSTDGTIELLASYGDRIKWISEPDNGHADAINKGWRMSRGEILTWLNADDMWEVPRAVSRAVKYFSAHPDVDAIYGDCGEIDSDGTVVGMAYSREWDLEYAVEYCDHCIPQPASFIRRRILDVAGWLDIEMLLLDHEFWLRVGLAGKIRRVPCLLAYARNQPGVHLSRKAPRSCVALTRKFFGLANVPESLRKKKRRAISNAYLRGIDYAWEGGRYWSRMFWHFFRAVLTDPSNVSRAARRIKLYSEIGAPDDVRLRWLLIAYTLLNAPRRTWCESQNEIKGILRRRQPQAENVVADQQNSLDCRDIESSFIAAQIPCTTGEALQIGSKSGYLGLVAAHRGFNVTAVDMNGVSLPYVHPKLRFIQGDILQLQWPPETFDVVLCCSTIDQIGLVGNYDISEYRSDGDLAAMARLCALMKPGGTMLLTTRVGRDAVSALSRVYGPQRLARLLARYIVEKEVFWVKDRQNRWIESTREAAFDFELSAEPNKDATALGCFVLRKPFGEQAKPIERNVSTGDASVDSIPAQTPS